MHWRENRRRLISIGLGITVWLLTLTARVAAGAGDVAAISVGMLVIVGGAWYLMWAQRRG